MDTKTTKNIMARDTLLYLPAKMLEGIIGFLTISLYTRFFVTDIFGDYTMVNTTVNVCNLLLLGWLVQSSFRYINTFNGRQKQKLFYSTAFTGWAVIHSIVFILGAAAILIFFPLWGKRLTQLIALGICMFFTYSTAQILFSLLGALRRIKLNLLLSVSTITGKLLITTILVNVFKADVVSALISNIVVDACAAAVIILRLELYKHINIKFFSRKIFKKFLKYSLPLVGVGVNMSLLNLSDRFIIHPMLGRSQVGIYTANYSISSAVFSAILLAVMRGVYPTLLKTWRQNNIRQSEELLSQAVRYYLLIALPAAVGLSVLSGPIGKIFLDRKYHEGSFVIAWVAIGMLFLGLTEYSNKAWELTANTKAVFRNSLISGLFNFASNIIFVPIYGYAAAAVNTTLAYLLYLILSYTGGRKILRWSLTPVTFARLIGSNAIMGGTLFIIVLLKPPSAFSLIWLVAMGAALYFGSLYVTKEIDKEAKQILGLVMKRFGRGS